MNREGEMEQDKDRVRTVDTNRVQAVKIQLLLAYKQFIIDNNIHNASINSHYIDTNNLIKTVQKLTSSEKSSIDIKQFESKLYNAMNDDFNTPIAIAHLFDLSKLINQVNDGKETLSQEDIEFVKNLFTVFMHKLLGLINESAKNDDQIIDQLMNTILVIRKDAKSNKDWATADRIRDDLGKLNIKIKDTKDGAEWSFE